METARQIDIEQVYLDTIYRDPHEFVTTVLGVNPTDQQCEILEAMRSHKRISVCSGHGIGKTAVIAWVIVWWLCTRMDCRVMITASKESQIKRQIWPEVSKWLGRVLPDSEWQKAANHFRANISVEATTIFRSDNQRGAFALGHVARIGVPETLQGFHHEHLLQITDETSAIPNEHMEAIESTLTESDNRLYSFSNPTRRTGWFADSQKTTSRYHRIKFSSIDSPLVSEEWIEDIAKHYGEHSNIYRIRVLGKFPKSDDDALILYDWIDAARERSGGVDSGPMIMGIDPGRSVDGDATGIVVRSGDRVLHTEQMWIDDLMKVAGVGVRLKNELIAAYPDLDWGWFAVDVIGLGAGVADALKSQGEEVEDVNVSEASTMYNDAGNKEAERLRDELWLRVRDWLKETGSLKGLDDGILEVLTAELGAPKYSIGLSGAIKVEGKKEMKKRGISSPNLADALCCTFAPGPQDSGFWSVII